MLRAGAWGLADQALISAANFVTMVALARTFVPADFGAFVLTYTALLLLNGLQTAFVTQPHNVLGQGRERADYAVYTTSTGVGQLAFAAAFSALALAAAGATALAARGAS